VVSQREAEATMGMPPPGMIRNPGLYLKQVSEAMQIRSTVLAGSLINQGAGKISSLHFTFLEARSNDLRL